jgi:thiamine biosynthesis lipoprotein
MPPRKSNRREFLKGQSALEAIGDLGLGADKQPLPPPGAATGATDSYLVQIARTAMACEFEVLLNLGQYPEGPERAAEALDLVDQLEAQLTVYRESSEVMEINRCAEEAPVTVEAALFALFQRARELSELTAGAFDITAGPLSKVWGFYRRQGQMPSAEEVAQALAKVDYESLELAGNSVRFLKPGMEINLGAIGKGYALDRMASYLRGFGITDFLIHGGNSSVLAAGNRQRADGRPGWTVALRHPLKPQVRLAEIELSDQALGTSGSGTQFFHYQGKRYGHILDPRTGWPADNVLSATLIAPSGEQADALSTACYVLGREGTEALCAARPELGALLVSVGRGGQAEILPVNMPPEKWRILP